MSKTLVEVIDVKKTFPVGKQQIKVLRGVNLSIYQSDFVTIFGPSGCGKSTLLHGMLGLEPPTDGTINLFGEDIYKYDSDMRAEIRKREIGMVYQQAHWISSLNVIENVSFPLYLLDIPEETAKQKAKEKLELVGMLGWSEYMPTELSSGQQQKVSLARALVNNPTLIITDEPTGNLDTKSGYELLKLLEQFNKKEGKTLLMVTHDLEYLTFSSRILHMIDGVIEHEYDGKQDIAIIKQLATQGKGKTNHSNDS